MKKIKINPGWINDIDDAELTKFSRSLDAQLETPLKTTDRKINNAILNSAPPEEAITTPRIKTPAWPKYGIAAALILILTVALVLAYRPAPLKTEYLVIGGKAPDSAARGSIKPGTVLLTAGNTWQKLQIADQALLEVAANSRLLINRLDTQSVKLELEYGELLVKTFPATAKTNYEIRTPGTVILFGSTILVRCRNTNTYLALFSGTASVKTGASTTRLLPGEEVAVRAENRISTGKMDTATALELDKFHQEEVMPSARITARLSLSCPVPDAELEINHKSMHFTDNIVFNLEPGTYSIRISKPGYAPYRSDITLIGGETKHLTCNLEPAVQESTPTAPQPTPGKTAQNKQEVRLIYPVENPTPPRNSPILGFAGSTAYLVAVMETALVFFDKTGKLLWEYPAESNSLFHSLPVIYKDLLYISSIDSVLSVNMVTRETTNIPAPGIIPNGLRLILHRDKLYFPYSAGIYTLNTKSNAMELFISCNSPVTPLFTEEQVYVASYIKPEITTFSLSGKQQNTYILSGNSNCTPVKIGNYIYAGDNTGGIYKLNTDLTLVTGSTVPGSITALTQGTGNLLFALAGNGNLYAIHTGTLEIITIIKVDTNPRTSIYYYKLPVSGGNRLYLGTEAGQLLLIDNGSAQIKEQLTLSKAAVSCSAFAFQNMFVIGTGNSEIFKIE